MKIESYRLFAFPEFFTDAPPWMLPGAVLAGAVALTVFYCLKAQRVKSAALRRRSMQVHTEKVKSAYVNLVSAGYLGPLLNSAILEYNNGNYQAVLSYIKGVIPKVVENGDQEKIRISLYELYGASSHHLNEKVGLTRAIAELSHIILTCSNDLKFHACGAYARLLMLDGKFDQALRNFKSAENYLPKNQLNEAKNLYQDELECAKQLARQEEISAIEIKLKNLE